MEDVGARTERSKTYTNPDGTKTFKSTPYPAHYWGGTGWLDIDTRIVPDPSRPGVLRSSANAWTAAFAPLPQGVTVTTTDGSIQLSPVGVLPVAPVAAPGSSTVTYPNAWLGIDLVYKVTPTGVKEDIVVKTLPLPPAFTFLTAGRSFEKTTAGLLRPVGGTPELGVLSAPEVLDKNGTPVAAARPSLVPSGAGALSSVVLSVDPTWAATLTPADLPIVVDPTWNRGSGNMTAYKEDGTTQAGLRIGNTNENGLCCNWRSVGYFPYEGLFGQVASVTTAEIHIWDRTAGTANCYDSPIYWATTYGYNSVGRPPLDTRCIDDNATSGHFNNENVRALYEQVIRDQVSGLSITFLGRETPPLYTYKQLNSFDLTITYVQANQPPAVPDQMAPAEGSVFAASPQVSARFVDPDGAANEPGIIDFQLEGQTGWINSNVTNGGTATQNFNVGEGQWRWRTRSYDGAVNSAWSGYQSFIVDPSGPAAPTGARSTTHDPSTTWFSSKNASFTWDAGTDLSGVTSWWVDITPSSTTIPTGNKKTASRSYTDPVAEADGQWWFHVRAVNGAGVPGGTAHVPFKIDSTKPTDPVILTASHANNSTTNNKNVSFTWSASTDVSSGLAGYSAVITTSSAAPATAAVTTTGTSYSTTLGQGTWYFHLQALDNSVTPNASTDIVRGPFTIDTLGPPAPTISSTTHNPETSWKTTTTGAFTFTMPTGSELVSGYRVIFDETAMTDACGATTQPLPSYTKTGITDGAHWIHVAAVDLAGNCGTTAHRQVLVDASAPPRPTATWPNHNQTSWYNDGSPTFQITASDPHSPISGYSWSLSTNSTTNPGTTIQGSSPSVPYSNLADGTYYFKARAFNGAGVASTPSVAFVIHIDRTPPSAIPAATSRTHPKNEPVRATDATVTWDATTDNLSGIAGYSYTWSTSSTPAVDGVAEGTAQSASKTLTNNSTWYLGIAAIDGAGNLGPTYVYGPMIVDPNAPPVNSVERQRFVDLWHPRAADDAFRKNWHNTQGIPADIQAEGFHSLSDEAHHYLSDALRASFQQTPDGDSAYYNEVLYRFVFHKDQLQGTDLGGDGTTAPSGDSSGEMQITKDARELSPVPIAPIPVTVPAAPVTTALANLVSSFPNTPTLAYGTPVGDLSAAAAARLNDLRNGVSGTAQFAGRVNDIGLHDIINAPNGPIFSIDKVPVLGWTICWQSATASGCRDVNSILLPTVQDVTGDNIPDVQATLGVDVGSLDLLGTAGLSFDLSKLPTAPANLQAHVWAVYDIVGTSRRVRLGWDAYSWHDNDDLQLPAQVKGTLLYNLTNLTAPLDVAAQVEGGGPAAAAMTFGVSNTSSQQSDPADAALRFSPVSPTTITYKQTSTGDDLTVDAHVTAAPANGYKLAARVITSSSTETVSTTAGIDRADSGLHLSAARHPRQSATTGPQDTVGFDGAAGRTLRYVQTRVAGSRTRTQTVGVDGTPSHAALKVTDQQPRSIIEYDADQRIGRIDYTSTDTTNNRRLAAEATGVPTTIDAAIGPCETSTSCTATNTKDKAVYATATTSGTLDGLFAGEGDTGHQARITAASIPTYVNLSYQPASSDLSIDTTAPIGTVQFGYTVNDPDTSKPATVEPTSPGDHLLLASTDTTLAVSSQLSQITQATAHYAAPYTTTVVQSANAAFRVGLDARTATTGDKDTVLTVDVSALPSELNLRLDPDPVALHVDTSTSTPQVTLGLHRATDLNATTGDGLTAEVQANGLPTAIDAGVTEDSANKRFSLSYKGTDRATSATAPIASVNFNYRRVPIRSREPDEVNATGTLTSIPGTVTVNADELQGTTTVNSPDGALGVADIKASLHGGTAACATTCAATGDYVAVHLDPARSRTKATGSGNETIRPIAAALRISGVKLVDQTIPDDVVNPPGGGTTTTTTKSATVHIALNPGGQDVNVELRRTDQYNGAPYDSIRGTGTLRRLPQDTTVRYDAAQTATATTVTASKTTVDVTTVGARLAGMDLFGNTIQANSFRDATDSNVKNTAKPTTIAATITNVPTHVKVVLQDEPSLDVAVTGTGSSGPITVGYSPELLTGDPTRSGNSFLQGVITGLTLSETTPAHLAINDAPADGTKIDWTAPAAVTRATTEARLRFATYPTATGSKTYLARGTQDDTRRNKDVGIRADVTGVPTSFSFLMNKMGSGNTEKQLYTFDAAAPVTQVIASASFGPPNGAPATSTTAVASVTATYSDAAGTFNTVGLLKGIQHVHAHLKPDFTVDTAFASNANRDVSVNVDVRRRADDNASGQDDLEVTAHGTLTLPGTLSIGRVNDTNPANSGHTTVYLRSSETISADITGTYGWILTPPTPRPPGSVQGTAPVHARNIALAEQTCGLVTDPTQGNAANDCRSRVTMGANGDPLEACTSDKTGAIVNRSWCSRYDFEIHGELLKALTFDSKPCKGCTSGSIDFGPGPRTALFDIRLRMGVESIPVIAGSIALPQTPLTASFGLRTDASSSPTINPDTPGGLDPAQGATTTRSGSRYACKSDVNFGLRLSTPVTNIHTELTTGTITVLNEPEDIRTTSHQAKSDATAITVENPFISSTLENVSGGLSLRYQQCTDKEVRDSYRTANPVQADSFAAEVWSTNTIGRFETILDGDLHRVVRPVDANGNPQTSTPTTDETGHQRNTVTLRAVPAAPLTGPPLRLAETKIVPGTSGKFEPKRSGAPCGADDTPESKQPNSNTYDPKLMPIFSWRAPAAGASAEVISEFTTTSEPVLFTADKEFSVRCLADAPEADFKISARVPKIALSLANLPPAVDTYPIPAPTKPGGIHVSTSGGRIGILELRADTKIGINLTASTGLPGLISPLTFVTGIDATVTSTNTRVRFNNVADLDFQMKAPYLSYAFNGNFGAPDASGANIGGEIENTSSTLTINTLNVSATESLSNLGKTFSLLQGAQHKLTASGGYYGDGSTTFLKLPVITGPAFSTCFTQRPALRPIAADSAYLLRGASGLDSDWFEFTFVSLDEGGPDSADIIGSALTNQAISILNAAAISPRRSADTGPTPGVSAKPC